jgi:hypothetical protein
MDAGVQAIIDAAELAAVRRQARKVYLESMVAAAVLAGIALAIPGLG